MLWFILANVPARQLTHLIWSVMIGLRVLWEFRSQNPYIRPIVWPYLNWQPWSLRLRTTNYPNCLNLSFFSQLIVTERVCVPCTVGRPMHSSRLACCLYEPDPVALLLVHSALIDGNRAANPPISVPVYHFCSVWNLVRWSFTHGSDRCRTETNPPIR